jgi:choline dehydrogenase
VQFDYVIVGAGSAGAVVASRLSEDRSVSVCLIEAGPPDKNPAIHIPMGLALMGRMPAINWNYQTEPQTALNGRRLYWPRGKTLGGSSAINAMCYIRGTAQNYDAWDAAGATGWNWQTARAYFRKSEDNERGADAWHGVGGPLSVSDLRHVNPLSAAFVAAAQGLQIPSNADFNGAAQEGLGLYQVTQRNGKRCSSATAFLSPDVRARANLTILTHAKALRLDIVDGRATTVVTRIAQHGVSSLTATREIILCGGTINSPQLLMLSGIGTARHLTALGLPVHADLPGVGQNLQDHLDGTLSYTSRTSHAYGLSMRGLFRQALSPLDYLVRRRGMLSSNVAEAGGFLKSSPDRPLPDIQFHFLPAILEDHGRTFVPGHGCTLHACNLYPESRGEILLASPDPDAMPAVDPRYLEHEADWAAMVAGLKLGRQIMESPVFERFGLHEIRPGRDTCDEAELRAFLRERAESIYHPVGTCRMGETDDAMSVVHQTYG